MREQDVGLLQCPETGAPLRLEIVERDPGGLIVSGALLSPAGRRYPIVRGIPRFVSGERYASSFGFEWQRWPRVQFEADNVGGPMAGHTTAMWETITGLRSAEVRGTTVVDFGCGSGRFLDVVRRGGGRAIGIDLSQSVEVARRNFGTDPDVLIVQGDITRPPFRAGIFDGGYTIGVLHHTPDPYAGLRALATTVRPSGWVACCVYARGDPYGYPSVERLRRLHNLVKPRLGYGPAVVYAYLAAYLLAPLLAGAKELPILRTLASFVEHNWLVALYVADARWRVLDTFDAITPAIATTHTGDEVRDWLLRSGCGSIRTTTWGATSAIGIRA
jgi:SAM-dependent methyltransferase